MYSNEDRGGFVRKPMVQGNWTCGSCGAQITKLPFEPRGNRLDSLKCKDCFRNERGTYKGGGSDSGRERSDRPMVEGSWSCADCGKEITRLPFAPSGNRPVRCIDCFRAGKTSRH